MYTIVLFLSVFVVKDVLSLSCYATDLNAPSGKVEHTVQECTKTIKAQLEAQGLSLDLNELQVDFRCYKVEAVSASQQVVIKGCIPKNGCEVVKPLFKFLLISNNSTIRNLECFECDTDKCNADLVVTTSTTTTATTAPGSAL